MSTNELEMKCRELRQLQNLIEEAQAEAEAIQDAIKAHMGDAEAIQAGEYKIGKDRQNRHHGPEKGPAGCGPGIHPGDHCPPVPGSMRKAPCISTDQSEIQEATTNHKGPGEFIIAGSLQKIKEEITTHE